MIGPAQAELLVRTLRDRTPPACLLAVCPNSPSVVRAALRAATTFAAPIELVATLNQVDLDGGYTGWKPAGLSDAVRIGAEQDRIDPLVLLGLDHGGPWKKDTHPATADEDVVRGLVKSAITAGLEAGYTIIHLDPTGRSAGAPAPDTAVMVDRTLDLLDHSLAGRASSAYPALEIGVEETGSVITRLESFLEAACPEIKRRAGKDPLFVVGNAGTRLGSDRIDRPGTQALVRVADRFGALAKVHYSDGVDNPGRYAALGVGGANVGPGLAAIEFDALVHLEKAVSGNRRVRFEGAGPVEAAVTKALDRSNRWRKWAPDSASRLTDVPDPERRWLLRTGSRYVWNNPDVRAARQDLAVQMRARVDVEDFVLDRLQAEISRYLAAFGFSRFRS